MNSIELQIIIVLHIKNINVCMFNIYSVAAPFEH